MIYRRDAFREIILLPPPPPEELLKGNQFFFRRYTASPLASHPFSPLVIASECIHAFIYIYTYIIYMQTRVRAGEWQPLCRRATMSRARGINKRNSFGNVVFRIKRRFWERVSDRPADRPTDRPRVRRAVMEREFTRAERRLMNNIKFCARPTTRLFNIRIGCCCAGRSTNKQ